MAASAVSDSVILNIEAPIYSEEDRRRLHQSIEEAIAAQSRRLVVDCTATGWFGPPILDELIQAQQRMASRGGELLLVTQSSKIRRILKAARVDRLKTFASVQSALANQRQSVFAAA